MTADQLKEAALRGDLTAESLIQQAGHSEWVPATNVKGLTFPSVPSGTDSAHIGIAPEAASPSAATAATAASATHASRHPRFATIRDLLAAYLNADIEVNLPDSGEYSQAHLTMLGTDHFEISLDTGRGRVFVPFSRIRVIWVTEMSTNASLAYRESHRISVELEGKR